MFATSVIAPSVWWPDDASIIICFTTTFGPFARTDTDPGSNIEPDMPPRLCHLPHSKERSALQRLATGIELSANALHPCGLPTIAKMVGKTWIEAVGNGIYRITPAGAAALKAEIPTPLRRRSR